MGLLLDVVVHPNNPIIGNAIEVVEKSNNNHVILIAVLVGAIVGSLVTAFFAGKNKKKAYDDKNTDTE